MSLLEALESQASDRGLLLRLQVGGAGGLQILRVAVARREGERLLLLGELKGWTSPLVAGLQLDTMRVQGSDTQGVGPVIWAATFAWALEATPCRRARLLAIRDDDRQHQRLVRYFRRLGFRPVRELGAGVLDLPLRLVWGGAGLLMTGDCAEGLERSQRLWGVSPGGKAPPAGLC
ncbi:MAG: hypothetical protein EBU30_08065 [Synechococcaceae bacterium WB6_3B_236]|nr:hypothetical protein [Synechococcaceae bacterium WB6_3B_236]